jgi:hypothetical protein
MATASELLAEARIKRDLARQFAEFAKGMSLTHDRELLGRHAAQLEAEALKLEAQAAGLPSD